MLAADPPRRPLPFLDRLGGDAPALTWRGGELTGARLAERIRVAATDLDPSGGRRLVLVGGADDPAAIVGYLAALAAGHVVLLVDGTDARMIGRAIAAYDPDDLLLPGERWAAPVERVQRHREPRHRLHPDLALLLGTSGSTGAPRTVRLSSENLAANAEAIASALELSSTDRAATTLPMHYCYGLSVIHAHLAAGAAVHVTPRSVVDRCFWDEVRDARVTTLAGVPYTFDLLDRVGFDAIDLPSLRLVTQAGGRLAPERVRRYAALGRERGWGFAVMYGQTEATARMAILPPDLAETRPSSVGRAIPGGSFRIEPVEEWVDPGVGELVYRGPNVMLGYAEGPGDLGRGRTVDELRTGDLARIDAEGLVEIVGRRSGFVKLAGLRVDLDQVERLAAARGHAVVTGGNDDGLVLAVVGDAEAARRDVLDAVALPAHLVRAVAVDDLPRLASGKPDRRAVAALAAGRTGVGREAGLVTADHATAADGGTGAGPVEAGTGALRVAAVYGGLLERPVRPGDTFVGLGGDSLSYVRVSLALEELLGRVPEAWPSMSVAALGALVRETRAVSPARRRAWRPRVRWIETSVALRALAILLIVATHVGAIHVLGGAHVLLAVAGYNFARFQLTAAPRWDRARGQLRAIARIALPAVAWVAVASRITDVYEPQNLVLLNAIIGPLRWGPTWHFWFIEVLVYILVAMTVLSLVPWFDRAERRWPFGVAVVLFGGAALTRSGLVDIGLLNTLPVFWLFVIGWAAARARTRWQRGAVLIAALASVPGFFGDAQREATIAGGLALLILVARVPVPAVAARAVGVLASASLYIYLVHWQVYPRLPADLELVAVGASLAAGIVAWRVGSWMLRAGGSAVDSVRRRLVALRPDVGWVARRPASATE